MKKMQIRMQLVCLFSMLLLFFPVELFAQQGTITGKVVDERGESVIGATVMVKGSTDGTITDLDGNFKINGKVGTTITVSYVGYAPLETIVKDPYLADLKLWAKNWDEVRLEKRTDRSSRAKEEKKGPGRRLSAYETGFMLDMRSFLKGDEGMLNQVALHVKDNPDTVASINYMANTNGFTLLDMITSTTRTMARKIMMALITTSPGIVVQKVRCERKRSLHCANASLKMPLPCFF